MQSVVNQDKTPRFFVAAKYVRICSHFFLAVSFCVTHD